MLHLNQHGKVGFQAAKDFAIEVQLNEENLKLAALPREGQLVYNIGAELLKDCRGLWIGNTAQYPPDAGSFQHLHVLNNLDSNKQLVGKEGDVGHAKHSIDRLSLRVFAKLNSLYQLVPDLLQLFEDMQLRDFF